MSFTETEFKNMIQASIADDRYLDTGEDQSLMQEAARRGMRADLANQLIDEECAQTGSVREKQILQRLIQELRQATDNDKFLDAGEETQILALCQPAPGYSKGLSPDIAIKTIDDFCQANGVRRAKSSGSDHEGRTLRVGVVTALVLVIAVGAWLWSSYGYRSAGTVADPSPTGRISEDVPPLSEARIRELVDMVGEAADAGDRGIWTEPPDRSALGHLMRLNASVTRKERAAPNFEQVHSARRAVCRKAVRFYCTLTGNPQESSVDWKERATMIVSACEEPELLAECQSWNGQ